MASANHIPYPAKLNIAGNIAVEWKRFSSQWRNYEVAADLTGESKKKRTAIFLACIGTEAYELFQAMHFAAAADREDLDKVVEAFQRHCIGEVNVTYERYTFNRRVQDVAETFDTFVADLRRLAKSCEFGTLEDSIIRDRIVIGIRDDPTRRKLLQTRKLDLNQAIDIGKASEVATKQLKDMSTPDEIKRVDTTQQRASRQRGQSRHRPDQRNRQDGSRDYSKNRRCQYCDRVHEPSKKACKAYGETCKLCSKKNHFAVVCKASKSNNRVQQLDSADEHLLALTNFDRKRLYATLNINNRPVRFQLDCGATVNLLPMSIFRELSSDSGAMKLRPAESTLFMFDNNVLKTNGMSTIAVQHPLSNKVQSLDFYMTETHKQPILGLTACLDFELLFVNENNICVLKQKENSKLTTAVIFEQYADLFEGIGKLEGELHLQADPNICPVRMPLRKIPVPIKDKVIAELNAMCRDNIITPVTEPSDWISALLVVNKPQSGVRICIDLKPLNKALKRDHYAMPVIDDVLPQLSKAKVFFTVDAKSAFWMIALDESSSRLTTFETPMGKFRWLRLPYGISPAPEIFQRKMHEALDGLEGVACIADDMLIYGRGETIEEAQRDHDKHLIALLERCRQKNIRLNKEKFKLNRETVT
jgi:hypothetical protein